MAASGAQVWRAGETVFSDAAQAGAELVLVLRLGPYLELDIEDLLQFHLDQRNRVTPVCDPAGGPLHAFAISASRRNDAAFLFRHQLEESRTPCNRYIFRGYINRLDGARDLRRLAVDAFTSAAALQPIGRELRPGVWAGEGVRIAAGARVLAPAYLGSYSKVRTRAVVTRYSVLEHHAEVDCGTVVEHSTLLPYTYVGAGLDLAHSVAGNRRVYNLRRNAEVQITDPKLVDAVPAHAPIRALASVVSLAAFLPRQFVRGIFPSSQREQPASLPAAVSAPSPALKSPAALEAAAESNNSQFPANLMVARRYGNE